MSCIEFSIGCLFLLFICRFGWGIMEYWILMPVMLGGSLLLIPHGSRSQILTIKLAILNWFFFLEYIFPWFESVRWYFLKLIHWWAKLVLFHLFIWWQIYFCLRSGYYDEARNIALSSRASHQFVPLVHTMVTTSYWLRL